MLEIDNSKYTTYEAVDSYLDKIASEPEYQLKGYNHLMYSTKLKVAGEIKSFALSEYVCNTDAKMGVLHVTPLIKELLDEDTQKPYFEVLLDIRREGRCYSRAIVIDRLKAVPSWQDIKKFVEEDIRKQKSLLEEINRRTKARKQ